MFYHDGKLQYIVKVDKPNPTFAKLLQQAIGGPEGKLRTCMQYLFQGWSLREPAKYRELLLDTGTEEIAHVELLSTAVMLNLESDPNAAAYDMGAESNFKEQLLGNIDPKQFFSSGLSAMPTDSNGQPFNGGWVVNSGNLASDMYANVAAKAASRVLLTRLYNATDDAGMKDLLSFLIARDTMHQNQWLAVLEELGDVKNIHPIPNTFPQEKENQDFNYKFISTYMDGGSEAYGRWSKGSSIDGKGEFSFEKAKPLGGKPKFGKVKPETYPQKEQMYGPFSLDGHDEK